MRLISFEKLISVLLAALILVQATVAPIAYAADANGHGNPVADLRRSPQEPLDSYLERVAAAQPELFQQAAMAAVQDAFNGVYGDDAPEDALEQRVAFYINMAIANAIADPYGFEAAARAAAAEEPPVAPENIEWTEPAHDPTGQFDGELTLASAMPAGFDPTFGSIPSEMTEPVIDSSVAPAVEPTLDFVGKKNSAEISQPSNSDKIARELRTQNNRRIATQALIAAPIAAIEVAPPVEFLPQTNARSVNASTKDVNRLRVEADAISDTPNTFDATGTITLSVKITSTDTFTNYVSISGPNAKVSQDADGKITGTGIVRVRAAGNITWTNIFTGDFGISNTDKMTVSIAPADGPITTSIKEVGDFKLVGVTTLSKLTLQDGGMSISVQLDPKSVGLTDSLQKINTILTPDGEFTTPTTDLSFKLAGLDITAKKISFTKKGGITSSEVEIKMPAAIGGGTGTLKSLKITSKAITIDGGNVKFALPDIAIGSSSRAVDAAQAASSSLKITDIEATVVFASKGNKLELEGTLELKLPGNEQKIKVAFEINPSGEFEGKLNKLNITLAGNVIKMKQIEITNSGLKVATAEIIISSITGKDGQKLTGTIKKITISGGGITLGEIGAKVPLPEIKLGTSVRLYELVGDLVVAADGASYKMTIKGKLDVTLPGNESQSIDITAAMDKEGKFSGELSELTVKIVKSTLVMTEVKFDANSFTAKSAELTLPPLLKSKKVAVENVVINKNGLNMSDATIDIGDIKVGGPVNMTKTKVIISRKGGKFSITIAGTIKIENVEQSVGSSATGSLTLHESGSITGKISGLSLSIAGMKIVAEDTDYANNVISAKKVRLVIPETWGGAAAEVNNLRISSDGISISGGKFELPKIKIGDIEMSLKGSLEKISNGYRIKAEGFFKMPNTGAGGCGGIRVGVTIALTSNRDVVMVLEPIVDETAAPEGSMIGPRAVDGFSLENIKVAMEDCYIPVGTTGFGITKVSGSFTLTNNVTKIELGITISTKVQIAGKRAVDVNGNAKFEQVKNPRKSELSITGAVEIFSMFKAAEAGVNLDFVNNKFSAELHIRAVVFQGGIEFSAWERNGEFYLTGRGYLRVGLPKAAIMSARCLPYSWWTWSKGWHTRRKCTPNIPSSTYWLAKILVEAGRFSNNAWGAKAKVRVLGFNVGAYVDNNGNFATRNVDRYRLATGRDAEMSRQLQRDLARGELSRAALSAEQLALVDGFSFAPGQTSVNFTVKHLTSTTIGFTHPPSGEVGLSLVTPNGLIITEQNMPGHVSFVTATYADAETPEEAIIETVITVQDAYVGEWQVQIDATSSADDPFTLEIVGTDPGPVIEELRVVETGENKADLVYDIETAAVTTTVSVYATLGPISDTVDFTSTETVTDSRGIVETVTVSETLPAPNYDGIYLTEFVINQAARTRAVGKQALDLSGLPGGDYFVWVTADDGENNPTRQYAAGAATMYGQSYVQHPWTPTWTAIVTPTIEYHGINLVWDASTNPDVDEYEVVVSRTENTPKESDIVIPTGAATFAELTGLLPNQQYYVTIVGLDIETGLVMDSQTLALKTIDAPFTMTASATDVSVVSGGEPVTVTLTLNSEVVPFPEDIFFYANDDAIENAFLLEYTFGEPFVTPTVTGTQTTLVIQAPEEAFAENSGQLVLEAFGAGGFVEVPINLTVLEPAFAIESSQNPITINEGDVLTVDLSALYTHGEQDSVQLDIDAPYGLEYELSSALLTANSSVVLTLTDTAELPFGIYDDYIDVIGWDGENERITRILLTVNKPTFAFNMSWTWDWVDVLSSDDGERRAPVMYQIDAIDWDYPIAVTLESEYIDSVSPKDIDPGQVSVHHADYLSKAPLGVVFQVDLVATSNGVTKTYTVNAGIRDSVEFPSENQAADYDGYPESGQIVAGAQYTVTPNFMQHGHYTINKVMTETVKADPYASLVEIMDVDTNLESCSVVSDAVVCDIGDRSWSSTGYPLLMAVAADAPADHIVTHHVEMQDTGGQFIEFTPEDNEASLPLVVVRESDLALEMTSTVAVAGETMVYTVTVVNNGPSDADNVEVLVFPFDADVVAFSAECSQEPGADVVCSVGDLAVDETATITVSAHVPAYARGSVESEALAISDSFDVSAERNELVIMQTPIEIDVALDAVIEFTDGPLYEGEVVTFTVSVTNTGPSEANDVTVYYDPPAELVLGGDASVVWLSNGVEVGGYDFFDLDNDIPLDFLEPGESALITLPMFVRDDTNSLRSNITTSQFAVWATESLTATADIDIELVNLAPEVEIVGGSTLTMSEGLSMTLQALTSDVRRDVLTTSWDLDNDGQFDDATGNVVLFGGATRDGDSSQIIHVKVTDDEGAEDTATATILIKNVAPMVEAGANKRQQAKDAMAVAATFVELSPDDTHTAIIDWGDGTVENGALSRDGSVSGSHLFTALGKYDVNVCVTDNDGAEGCDSFEASIMCIEHGTTIAIDSVEARNSERTEVRVTFSINNGSGVYTVPAGTQITLYAGDTALHTAATGSGLAVGQSESFSFDWSGGATGSHDLMVRFNDDGTGTPTDALLCALDDVGKSRIVAGRKVALPLGLDPIALDDSYDGAATAPIVVSAEFGVLANDNDPDSSQLTARLVAQPIKGTVLMKPDGAFQYLPAGGGARQVADAEVVTFTYAASDGFAEVIRTVTLNLSDGNSSNAVTTTSDVGSTLTVTGTSTTEVAIPVGALSQAMTPTLALSVLSLDNLTGSELLNHVAAVNLQAYINGSPTTTMRFDAPVTMTIDYSGADLSDTDESTLKLTVWDGTKWIDAASTCSPTQAPVLDTVNNTLTVQVCQTGQFSMQGGDLEPLYKYYFPFVPHNAILFPVPQAAENVPND